MQILDELDAVHDYWEQHSPLPLPAARGMWGMGFLMTRPECRVEAKPEHVEHMLTAVLYHVFNAWDLPANNQTVTGPVHRMLAPAYKLFGGRKK
jgi:hypothetical protein